MGTSGILYTSGVTRRPPRSNGVACRLASQRGVTVPGGRRACVGCSTCWVASPQPGGAALTDDPRFASVRRTIHEALTRDSIPSIALSVAVGGQVVWEEAFGWADWARRSPATPATRYPIASVFKPFVATVRDARQEQTPGRLHHRGPRPAGAPVIGSRAASWQGRPAGTTETRPPTSRSTVEM